MNLTLDDLIGKCDGCGGTGKKPEEQSDSGGGNPYGRRVLERYDGNPFAGECGLCTGTGRRGLTEAGRALIDLLGVVDAYKAKNRLPLLKSEARDSSAE